MPGAAYTAASAAPLAHLAVAGADPPADAAADGDDGDAAGCPPDAVPQPTASSAIPEIAAASVALGVFDPIMMFATLSVGVGVPPQHSNEK